MTYTLEQAQTNFAQLIAEVDEGKEVVIQREGGPAVRLELVKSPEQPSERGDRELGLYRGLAEYDDSALDPLTDKELVEYGFGFMLDKRLVSEEAQDKKAG